MRRLSFYMFLLAAAAVILFLSWSLFSGNTGSGADFPPNAGGPAGEASGTSQAEQEKLKNLAAYQGGEREILDLSLIHIYIQSVCMAQFLPRQSEYPVPWPDLRDSL